MKKAIKIYLDTNHLVNLLDEKDDNYKELSKIISNKKIVIYISNVHFLELFQSNRDTLNKRSINAKKYQFLTNEDH